MSAKDEGKTFWVWAQIEESVHTTLLELSTATGKHPRTILEIALEDYIVNWVAAHKSKGDSVPRDVELESIFLEDRKSQVYINHVKQLAYGHIDKPTDDSAERLARACELAGISVESIIEEVSSKPHMGDIIADGGTLNMAEMYLLDVMQPGQPYQSREIISYGEAKGIKKYLITEAKRKLGIVSRRDSGSWVWILPSKKMGSVETDTVENPF